MIHMKVPQTLLNYTQKSEWTEQDELVSETIIIVSKWVHQKIKLKKRKIQEKKILMRQFVHELDGVQSCRRVMLNYYLNAEID